MTGRASYAVLDQDGRLNEAASRNPHRQEDPASTTKVWTLYTLISMVEDGTLPAAFLERNEALIQAMMVHSNNDAAQQLAAMAAQLGALRGIAEEVPPCAFYSSNRAQIDAVLQTGDSAALQRVARAAQRVGIDLDGRIEGGIDAVSGFANYMNYYANPDRETRPPGINDQEHASNLAEAGDRALSRTQFYTASGMNHEQHFSTPRDMAMMMFRLRADFADVPGARAAIEACNLGNSGSTGSFAEGHSEYGKTGTAVGNHGSRGAFSFVGVPRMGGGGVYAIAGAYSTEDRIALSRRIAGSMNQNIGEALPALGEAELDRDYLGEDFLRGDERRRAASDPAEAERLAAEAERRREAARVAERQEIEYENANPFQQLGAAIGRALARLFNIGSQEEVVQTPPPAPSADTVIDGTLVLQTIGGVERQVNTVGISLAAQLQAKGLIHDQELLHALETGGITVGELARVADAARGAGLSFNPDYANDGVTLQDISDLRAAIARFEPPQHTR